MANLWTEYNSASNGGDQGGCWSVFGYRSGSTGPFNSPIQLTIEGFPSASYGLFEELPDGYNPNVTAWGNGVGQYALVYGGCGIPCDDSKIVIFDVVACIVADDYFLGCETSHLNTILSIDLVGGGNAISGNWDLELPADRSAFETALSSWLITNGYLSDNVTINWDGKRWKVEVSTNAPLESLSADGPFGNRTIDFHKNEISRDYTFFFVLTPCGDQGSNTTELSSIWVTKKDDSFPVNVIDGFSFWLPIQGEQDAAKAQIEAQLASMGVNHGNIIVTSTAIDFNNVINANVSTIGFLSIPPSQIGAVICTIIAHD